MINWNFTKLNQRQFEASLREFMEDEKLHTLEAVLDRLIFAKCINTYQKT